MVDKDRKDIHLQVNVSPSYLPWQQLHRILGHTVGVGGFHLEHPVAVFVLAILQ
jgi:hypothetical protein